MATNLSTKFSVDMGSVVRNAITSVRNIRATERSRKESEFQRAVAGGMTYQDQLKFREKQLEEENTSSVRDADHIQSLGDSIATTKKLARFETIRTKYKQSLDSYVTGKSSIGSHISILEGLLAGETEPDKRNEIQDLLTTARKEQTTIEINAVKNRALVAQKDNSTALIDQSISEVQSRRALASINKNDDEVAAWDDTLLALKNAKSKLLIENGLNEITFRTNRENLKSGDKLGLFGSFLAGADAATPITYLGVTYPSLKAYWESKRGEYITTDYFDDVKKEIESKTSSIASTNAYGQIPVARIQAVNEFYNTLKNRDEFKAYVDRIEQERVDSVTGMANNLYTSLIDEANAQDTPAAYARAEKAILDVENRMGLKIARPAFDAEVAAGKTIAADVTKKPPVKVEPVPAVPLSTPSTVTTTPPAAGEQTPEQRAAAYSAAGTPAPAPTPAPTTTPAPAPTPPLPKTTTTAPKTTVVKAGETLSAIAQRELGDASRWKELKAEDGTAYDEETAKTLQIGTKLVIPQ